MYQKLFLLLIVFTLSLRPGLYAQDVHFSQFETSSLFMNPALTGDYHGDWRIGTIYRNQWRSVADPFESNLFYFDRHFYLYSKQINIGVVGIHDVSGVAKLTNDKVYLSISHTVQNGRSAINIGIQPGLAIKYFDVQNLTFPSQYDNSIGHFNNELDNFERGFDNTSVSYLDIGAGLSWSMNLPKIRPSVGFAIFHLNQPNESFNSQESKLSIRQVIHGNVLFRLKENRYLKPSFVLNAQNKANSILIGADVGKKYNNRSNKIKELFGGIYLRSGFSRNYDAIIPMAGFQYKNVRIGMSYDVNISSLNIASESRGAFELSLIYTALSTVPKHSTIPCERY